MYCTTRMNWTLSPFYPRRTILEMFLEFGRSCVVARSILTVGFKILDFIPQLGSYWLAMVWSSSWCGLRTYSTWQRPFVRVKSTRALSGIWWHNTFWIKFTSTDWSRMRRSSLLSLHLNGKPHCKPSGQFTVRWKRDRLGRLSRKRVESFWSSEKKRSRLPALAEVQPDRTFADLYLTSVLQKPPGVLWKAKDLEKVGDKSNFSYNFWIFQWTFWSDLFQFSSFGSFSGLHLFQTFSESAWLKSTFFFRLGPKWIARSCEINPWIALKPPRSPYWTFTLPMWRCQESVTWSCWDIELIWITMIYIQ